MRKIYDEVFLEEFLGCFYLFLCFVLILRFYLVHRSEHSNVFFLFFYLLRTLKRILYIYISFCCISYAYYRRKSYQSANFSSRFFIDLCVFYRCEYLYSKFFRLAFITLVAKWQLKCPLHYFKMAYLAFRYLSHTAILCFSINHYSLSNNWAFICRFLYYFFPCRIHRP